MFQNSLECSDCCATLRKREYSAEHRGNTHTQSNRRTDTPSILRHGFKLMTAENSVNNFILFRGCFVKTSNWCHCYCYKPYMDVDPVKTNIFGSKRGERFSLRPWHWRWGLGDSTTPWPLYRRERPGTRCTGGWVVPRAGPEECGKSRPHRDSIPGPSIP